MAAAGLVALAMIWTRSRDQSLERVHRAGVIRVGYAIEAPYAYLQPDGRVTGESPELARIIAARLGIPKLTWRLVDFGSLLDELESGNIDLIAAGMAITPERQKRAHFTYPTVQAPPALLVRRGNPRGLHRLADLKTQAGATIVVLSGSIEEHRLRHLGVSTERLLTAADVLSAQQVVATGRADALLLSAPTLRHIIRIQQVPTFELVELPSEPGMEPMRAAQAFRPSDRALNAAWDAEVRRFVGTPEHLRLLKEFGFEATDMPPPPKR